ncbi:MAG: hypothetical protein Q8K00_10770 [Syntrophales bacterium]|nr:hypothetical protein [Syntrophales bacterium]
MSLAILRKAQIVRMLVVAWIALLLSGCMTMRLISDYDEPTDKALTAIQHAADDFITKLVADAPSEQNGFDRHKQFYADIDQQLRRLEFRVMSIPKNSQTVTLVGNVRTALLGEGKCTAEGNSLRDLHCIPENLAKGPSKTALQIAQRYINQTIGAALALELAKKQGLEQNK